MDRAEFLALLRDPEIRGLLREALAAPVPLDFEPMEDFAVRQSVSLATVKRWVRLGLPSFKQGKVRRVDVTQAVKWLQEGHGNVVRRSPRRRAA